MNKNQTLKTIAIVIATVIIVSIALNVFSGEPQTSPPSSPDLIISDFYKESSSCTGGVNSICNFTLSAIVENIGGNSAERNVLEASINGGLHKDYGQIPSLESGQSAKVFTGFLNVPRGSYNADSKADYLGQVSESDENNNERTLNFQLP